MCKTNFREWGWNDRFQNCVTCPPEWFPARVTAQERGLYDIISENGTAKAAISGKFRYETKNISGKQQGLPIRSRWWLPM